MVKGFYKDLICCILIVLLLLGVCVSIDYADEDITITCKQNTTSNLKVNDTDRVIGLNESDSYIVVKSSDKIHTIAPKYPIIGMYAKPSCGCRYGYYWHYREFVNYCPNCYHYGTLRCNPKGVPEREYTCARCSSDFCGVCGKEKYSWSSVYLRRA